MDKRDNEVRKKVLLLFGVTDEEAEKDIKTIQEWMTTQPHLPEIMGKTHTIFPGTTLIIISQKPRKSQTS